jgi:hypothetical protein
MKTSKYAPKTPAETLAHSRSEKLKREKEKTTRLLGRLHWKAELLMASYYKALEIVRAAEAQQDPLSVSNYSLNVDAQQHANFLKKQAESMFKIDFFEFYTLLERFITTCLSILGVNVSGSAPQTNINALRYITNPDLQCPLHASFGVHGVRVELGLAKEFRNTWKDADERVIASKWDDDKPQKNITLTDEQLGSMLRALISGCEHAHGVVQSYSDTTTNGQSVTSRDFENLSHSLNDNHSDDRDTPFEYMDDAMELD